MTRSSSLILATTLSALALTVLPAAAQYDAKPGYVPAHDEAYYDDEIIVIAPGVERERTGRRSSSTGAPIETLTTSHVVATDDLDLRSDSDVYELRRRIRATAREACNELDRASRGVMLTSDGECIRDAVRDAMLQADDMVYYART